MHLILDSIIYQLQAHGGITQFWQNLCSRMKSYPDLDTEEIAGRKLLRYNPLWMRCDVFHSSYYRLNFWPGVRNVVTVYDFLYERGHVESRFRHLHIWQKRAAIRRADAVVCISENTRQDLLRFYPDAENRASVVHLAAGHSEPGEPGRAAHIEARPFFLFVGHRYGYKQFELVVQAMTEARLFDQYDLVCTGSPFSEAEQKSFSDRQIAMYVKSIPGATQGEMQALYAHAKALVYPSLYEGFGLPVVEAMTAGCPVVACDSSSIPEVAGNAALLFRPADLPGLVRALEQICQKGARERYAALGQIQAEKFSWEKTVAGYHKIYQALK